MKNVVDLAFNVTGQTFFLDVPEGQPTTITSVSVFRLDEGDNATAESATTGSASIDSVDTIVDADSGKAQPDSRIIYVNDTTGITVGRDYLVTGSGGEKEWVEVVEVTSGTSVTVRAPLANDYVSGNAFQGTRISVSVDSTWVADAHNLSDATPNPSYRIRWEYVVSGTSHVRYSFADLVRAPGEHTVRPIDIERMVPGYLNALPVLHREDRGRALIDEAYTQVAIDFHEQGIADEQVQNSVILNELVKRKTVVLWAEARAMMGGALEPVEVARTSYAARWDQLVRAPSQVKVPVADQSGAGHTIPSQGLTVR